MKALGILLASAALMGGAWAQSHDHGGAHGDDHDEAIGTAGDPAEVSRTVKVDMTDNMRFTPASVDASQGETIRFVVSNSGQVKHEFVLGTDAALKAHGEMMKKYPQMEHADPNQVAVAPGKTGEVIWRFSEAGKVAFACQQPGHYDAGMKGVVKVAGGAASRASTLDRSRIAAPTCGP